MITAERWRGFDHGALARDLAADQAFSVIITDLDTDPASIGNTLRLTQGDPTALVRPRVTTNRRCAGSTPRRARPPTRRASATPTAR